MNRRQEVDRGAVRARELGPEHAERRVGALRSVRAADLFSIFSQNEVAKKRKIMTLEAQLSLGGFRASRRVRFLFERRIELSSPSREKK